MASVPLVYACSGGSGAGQVANGVAVCLDRLEIAEMWSTAGIGGGDERHLAVVDSGRPILAIDGCPDDCARRALACRGIVPILHIRLDRRGTDRHRHESYDQSVIERELAYVADQIQRLEWGEHPDAE
jgi:uncharacterized metal-binding protein